MSEIDDKSMTSGEWAASQPESSDPGYLAWVDGKIRQGQKDLKDPAACLSEQEVWKELGIEN
jgi:hypothetical protein|tara:strand:+ start:352 stop:537 length:186 start_codon:yes stop_codon:yes gene_type:complete